MKYVALNESEYTRLAEVVGSLAIAQFDGDQEAYREVIHLLFETFVDNSNGSVNYFADRKDRDLGNESTLVKGVNQ